LRTLPPFSQTQILSDLSPSFAKRHLHQKVEERILTDLSLPPA
jgi:uncharacterized membrane protein